MYGLFICQPFARRIINGKKEFEYRNWKTHTMMNKNFYLLTTGGKVLGIIKFINVIGPLERDYKYAYKVKVIKKFKRCKHYKHPLGAVIWVKKVKLVKK